MSQTGYFMAMGGLGVSLAGFAGLLAALHHPDAGSPRDVYRWRIRETVISAFQLAFLAIGSVVFFEATQNLALTARVFSGIAAALFAIGAAVRARPGPAWPSPTDRRAAVAATYAWAAVMAGNIVVGAEWYLMAVMLILLLGPVLVFVRAVIDSTKPPASPS